MNLIGSAPAGAAPAQDAGQHLTGAELKACRADGTECLRLTSPEGQGSQLKPMQRLRNPVVFVERRGKTKPEELRADWALVNLESNELTLVRRLPDGVVHETTFDLGTLERRETVVR